MIFNELNRSEAEGKSINYVVHMKAKDGKSKKFYMTNVRNQEPGIHSISSNLFMLGIADKDLPGNNGEQVEFYVAGSDDGQNMPMVLLFIINSDHTIIISILPNRIRPMQNIKIARM